MEKSQQVKTKRKFPLNLYNKLEQKLKNKSEDTLDTMADGTGIQAEKTEKTDKLEKIEDTSLVKCPKCGKW